MPSLDARLALLRDVLTQADLAPRRRLLSASHRFWRVVFYDGQLSPENHQKADALVATLFASGTMPATVEAMDDATVTATLRRLEDFLRTCQADVAEP